MVDLRSTCVVNKPSSPKRPFFILKGSNEIALGRGAAATTTPGHAQ
jgi:hypothetical protein